MPQANNDDPAYCRRRAADFRAKAKAATGWLMKQGLQAAAHEYELRASMLEASRSVTQAAYSKPRPRIG
jgi:hypothetical protein